MKTEDILDMIDHTLSDYTSPDAMRWTPEAQPQKGLREGDTLTLNQVREALRSPNRSAQRVAIVRQLLEQTGAERHWEDDTVYPFGSGVITTVDTATGETIEIPFVSGRVRPSQ